MRRRARADVVRRRSQVRPERGLVMAGHPGDAVELADVPVRIVQRGDRPGVVEERVVVPPLGPEAELVGDVVLPVAVVVDVDRVERVRVEVEEVRPPRGLLERDVVRDDRDGVRPVRAHERIEVRVVGGRIVRDQGRFAVARGLRRPWARSECDQEPDRPGDECQKRDREAPVAAGCCAHLPPSGRVSP